MPYPSSKFKVSLPDAPRVAGVLHGIPEHQAGILADLLAYVRRHRAAGRPIAEVRADALFLARSGGRLPLYSSGGVADTINAIVGAPKDPSRDPCDALERRKAEGARGFLTLHLTLLDAHGRIPSLLSLCSGCGRVLVNGRVV